MRMTIHRLGTALMLVLVGLAGCNRAPAPAPAAPAAAATPITIVKPEKKAVVRTIEQPGTIQAFEETVLLPKVAGYVRAISPDPRKAKLAEYDRTIDIGSQVSKDQVLAVLDVPELDEDYKQGEALVRQADAEVTQAEKSLAAAVAGVSSAKAFVNETRAALTRTQANYERWQSESERVNRLVKQGVIDTQTRDETLNQFKSAEASQTESVAKVKSAEADVVKAEADREKAVADVVAANARRDVARANLRRIEAMRNYTQIKAPYDGIVTRRSANTGDYVTSEGKSGLFAMARIDPVRVVVHVPEADAGLVEVGQELQIVLPTVAAPVKGKVVRTSWSLEPGSRTLRTEVDLPNPNSTIRPGMYVSTKLLVRLPEAWAVPVAAVGKINDQPVMYLIENGKAVRVPVLMEKGDASVTQVIQYQRPGSAEWTAVTGEEKIGLPAAALTDGQTVP